jgi:NAD+--dinitrogen-reductase ADP-D-ribosyltransferase
VGLPAATIASVAFNAAPVRLVIAATRETHHGLFTLLDQTESLREAAEIFDGYMQVAFGLRKPERDGSGAQGRAYRSSYVKVLQGWGFDSNGAQGAVLKGWVESRFGITPTFHGAPLAEFPSDAWVKYVDEKLGSRFHNNCIHMQLDVLFEYCQFCIERFRPFGEQKPEVYRGTYKGEAPFVASSHNARRGVVRFNNVVSFSLERERAEEFGDWVLATSLPPEKVVFFPGLLDNQVLNGEGEVLAIGGDFEVTVSDGF